MITRIIRMLRRTYPSRMRLIFLATAAALLFRSGPALASKSCVSVELFLYNLTGNQITASWIDQNGNKTSQAINGQNVVYLGQECINVSGEHPFQLGIQDLNDGWPDAEYTIDSENCLPENWQNAQSNFPSDCWDPNGQFQPPPLSYYISSDQHLISLSHTCLNGTTPSFSVDFNQYSGQRFSWPIALGTYEPTSGQGMSALPVLPGLSPSGVTPCVGSACVIPDHDNDYNFWPVTIYWYSPGSGNPGFTYNSDTTISLSDSATGLNVPSRLSNYEEAYADDVYLPPSSTSSQTFPAPCWPTFDSSGSLTSCSPTTTNVPAFVANPNAKSGLAQTVLKFAPGLVSPILNLIIRGIF